ncbi:MAG: amino acid adenylation domain-containing protein, partial [bacterium]|nr:amino acid adenylation domain-containing protein [bacterium]
ILQQMEAESVSYNMPQAYPLPPEIDKERLEAVFAKLIARHESLRTSFHIIDDTPVQVVDTPGRIKISIDHYTTEEVKTKINSFIRPFDLSGAPLLRMALVELETGKNLLLDMHHIIFDGTSQALLMEEYKTLAGGGELSPLRLQYKDYALWQNSDGQQMLVKAQEEFWINRFSGELPVLELPLDYPRPTMQSSEGKIIRFLFKEAETKNLKEIAGDNNATLYMVILSIFVILLSKLSGQEDIIIGTPTAGRRHADLESIIGLFINTLPILSYPTGEKTFTAFLREVKEHTLDAFENQEYQFEELVDRLALRRDTGRTPIFDVMFNMLNITAPGTRSNNNGEKLQTAGAVDTPRRHKESAVKFDMTLIVEELDEIIELKLRYATKLFMEKTINRIVRYIDKIVQTLIAEPAKKIARIEIIPEMVKKEKLAYFNQNLVDDTVTNPLQDKLKRTFDKYADKIAIRYGNMELSYRELERKANTISNWIQKNAPRGSYIGILVQSRVELISAMMGILKAGSVFIPLNTMFPNKRLETMIKLTGAGHLITDGENEKNASAMTAHNGERVQTVTLDETFYRTNPAQPTQKNTYHPEDKISVFFTSGTTGKPKAVTGINKSLVQFIQWEIQTLNITPSYCFSQFTAVGFDPILRDVFTAICAGATICVPGRPDIIAESKELVRWIDSNSISLIHCVPGIFRIFNSPELTPAHFRRLKYILLVGEAVNPYELKKWRDSIGGRVQMINLYGPTETMMARICHFITAEDIEKKAIPVGKAIKGSRVIVLDKGLNICDNGLVGEVYFRTPYSSAGYCNDPEATREKFIPNPFQPGVGELYRTGDLGRKTKDGNLHLLGRMDRQTKIRGIRIELVGIEATLMRHHYIKEAIVLAEPDHTGETALFAYLVKQPNQQTAQSPGPDSQEAGGIFRDGGIKDEDLREYLSQILPGYMVPSFFIPLEKIPLNTNGKLDRNALTRLKNSYLQTHRAYSAPGNEMEKIVVAIWAGILGIQKETISIDDDFFRIGGHSLKATVMVSKIHKELNLKISLLEVFKRPTIRAIASALSTLTKDKYDTLKPVEKKEYYPLSSAQKRIYFLQQMDLNTTVYNMPQSIQMGKSIQKNRIENVFRELITRHESLRTSFKIVEEEPVQSVHDAAAKEFKIEYYDINQKGQTVETEIKKFIRPFDLRETPLIRSGLIRQPDGNHILIIDMHHVISDGTSRMILTGDFVSIYNGKERKPLRIQYKDFTMWQAQIKKSGQQEDQERYWLDLYPEARRQPGAAAAEGIPRLEMHTDYKRPEVFTYAGASHRLTMDAEETAAYKRLAAENGATLYMNALATLNTLFYKYTGQTDIIIGTPVAGRSHADLQHIVGMFVNTLPMRNHPGGEKEYRTILKEVVNRSIQALQNQDVPFEELVDKLEPRRDPSRNPIFDISMLVQNVMAPGGGTGTREIEKETPGTASEKGTVAAGNGVNGTDRENSGSRGERAAVQKPGKTTAKFDISFSIYETPQNIHVEIEY